jgi:hypothetical protein
MSQAAGDPGSPMVMPARQGALVLVLGVLGLVICCVCAPFAWTRANSALAEYGDEDPGDRSIVEAGRVLGIIGTVLWVLVLFRALMQAYSR